MTTPEAPRGKGERLPTLVKPPNKYLIRILVNAYAKGNPTAKLVLDVL